MKKIFLFIVVMLLTAGVTYAQDYAVTKAAGEYHVSLKMKNNPAVVGENPATIEVTDAKGNHVPAEVRLRYFMTTMLSMEYEAKAESIDDVHAAVIKPTMPGAWKAEVTVKVRDGKTHKTTFDFNAQ
jgi:major membrane immunogen (membrane-anchored lipoprotein)